MKKIINYMIILIVSLILLKTSAMNIYASTLIPTPSTTRITEIKAGSKQKVTVKWKKAKNATEYEVRYTYSNSTYPVGGTITTKKTSLTFISDYGQRRIYVTVTPINRIKGKGWQAGFPSKKKSVYDIIYLLNG